METASKKLTKSSGNNSHVMRIMEEKIEQLENNNKQLENELRSREELMSSLFSYIHGSKI